MDNLPRLLFFTSGVIVISTAFILFTTELLAHINTPHWSGTLLLAGYGLVYLNLVLVSSRRYMRRLKGPSSVPFILAALIAIPPILWVSVYDSGLEGSYLFFVLTIVFSCALGAYLGHRSGLTAQHIFWEKVQKQIDQNDNLPDDLKRPHDNLNKN